MALEINDVFNNNDNPVQCSNAAMKPCSNAAMQSAALQYTGGVWGTIPPLGSPKYSSSGPGQGPRLSAHIHTHRNVGVRVFREQSFFEDHKCWCSGVVVRSSCENKKLERSNQLLSLRIQAVVLEIIYLQGGEERGGGWGGTGYQGAPTHMRACMATCNATP